MSKFQLPICLWASEVFKNQRFKSHSEKVIPNDFWNFSSVKNSSKSCLFNFQTDFRRSFWIITTLATLMVATVCGWYWKEAIDHKVGSKRNGRKNILWPSLGPKRSVQICLDLYQLFWTCFGSDQKCFLNFPACF